MRDVIAHNDIGAGKSPSVAACQLTIEFYLLLKINTIFRFKIANRVEEFIYYTSLNLRAKSKTCMLGCSKYWIINLRHS